MNYARFDARRVFFLLFYLRIFVDTPGTRQTNRDRESLVCFFEMVRFRKLGPFLNMYVD